MPLYVIDSNSLQQKLALERSPEVLLLTDASRPDQVPAALRDAADHVVCGSCITPETFRGSGHGDGSIICLGGETMLEGLPESIRRNLRHPGRTTFATVHFPGVTNVDLLAIQPRLLAAGRHAEEAVSFNFHIKCAGASLHTAPEILREMREPWARLSCALYEDQVQNGAGLAQLDRLRSDQKLPPILDALVLRNLIVLQMRHGRPRQALKLVQQARRKYPAYAELGYIEAMLAVQNGDGTRAITLLEEITTKSGGVFAGSGGETSYRAQWLVAWIGEIVGNQSVSFSHYYPGVCARPPFEPSVVGLLKQRLPNDVVDSMQWELCHLVRREPRYLEPVFYFLLVHRGFSAARRVLHTLEMEDAQRAGLLAKLESVFGCYQKRAPGCDGPIGVILDGPFFVHSSIARINMEIAGALISRKEISTGLEPNGFALAPANVESQGHAIRDALYRRPPQLDLTIRHHWPHDFSRPAAGKLAVIVPWEFSAVPLSWVRQIKNGVDELWVPSQFVKDVFAGCGVPPERIAVVPNGVNTGSFCPQGNRWRPPEAHGFTFLFVGGAIERKGVDLLVKAYQRVFTARDDVTLIIKDIGSTSFYRHMTLIPWIMQEAKKPLTPRILVLLNEFNETKLAELYRGCHALVLPYRGEGFGMPLLEAMSCGKPVITTAEGPAAEFCPADCTYFIPARSVPIPGGIGGFGKLAAEPEWFAPDADELARLMRQVYDHPAEAAARGARGAERIRPAYNWRRIADMYLDRVIALAGHQHHLTAHALHSSD